MAHYDIVEGEYDVSGAGIGIVAARFNARFTDRLLEGALRVLDRHGVADPTVVRVPGAFEIPLAARRLAGVAGRRGGDRPRRRRPRGDPPFRLRGRELRRGRDAGPGSMGTSPSSSGS